MNDSIEINVTIGGNTVTKNLSVQEWYNTRDAQFGDSPCDDIVGRILWDSQYYIENRCKIIARKFGYLNYFSYLYIVNDW